MSFAKPYKVVGRVFGPSACADPASSTSYNCSITRQPGSVAITVTGSYSIASIPNMELPQANPCFGFKPGTAPLANSSLEPKDWAQQHANFPSQLAAAAHCGMLKNSPGMLGALASELNFNFDVEGVTVGRGTDTLQNETFRVLRKAIDEIQASFKPGPVEPEFNSSMTQVRMKGGGQWQKPVVSVEIDGRINSAGTKWADMSHVEYCRNVLFSGPLARAHNHRAEAGEAITGFEVPGWTAPAITDVISWLTEEEYKAYANAMAKALPAYNGQTLTPEQLQQVYGKMYPEGIPDPAQLASDAEEVSWWDRFWNAAKDVGGGVADFISETDTSKLLTLGAGAAIAADSDLRKWLPLALVAGAIVVLK